MVVTLARRKRRGTQHKPIHVALHQLRSRLGAVKAAARLVHSGVTTV